MKNIFLFCLISTLVLSACGKNEEEHAQQAPPPANQETKPEPEDHGPLVSNSNARGLVAMNRAGMQGYSGVMVQSLTYTDADLDYVAAIKSGNARHIRSLLDAGTININSGDETGVSGLIIAASLKNSDVVAAILDKVTQGDIKILDRTDKLAKTPLIHAAESGTPEIIAMLRKKGANPNIYDVEQNFALLILVEKNDIESVKALINDYPDAPPANLDLQNSNGEAAVLVATKNNNREMVKLLKDKGATLDSFDIDGITPLIYAVSKNDRDLFDYLLSLRADMNYLGIGKKTPLLYAIETKNYDFAKYILDKGANPNIHVKDLPSPLQLAVASENANPEIVSYLLAKGAALTDPQIPLGNVIGRSIYKGNAPVITKLIATGAKVSMLEDKNDNGLLRALNVEDSEIALLMLDNGADMNKLDANGYSALALSAKKKYKNVFDTLVKRGVDVNQTSQNPKLTPLEIVMDNDDGDMMETMLSHGLKANLDSLLLRAVNNKADNITPILLKHGANANAANNVGEPAIWTAIAKDDNIVARLLADNGAKLDVQDIKGLTPLSLAINKSNLEMAQYFIDKGANPNITDNNGFTSLAYAAANGQGDLVKSLMAHKADVSVVDKNNMTIQDLIDVSKLPQAKKDEIKQILLAPATPAPPVPPTSSAVVQPTH